jgi:hypothetical protein
MRAPAEGGGLLALVIHRYEEPPAWQIGPGDLAAAVAALQDVADVQTVLGIADGITGCVAPYPSRALLGVQPLAWIVTGKVR